MYAKSIDEAPTGTSVIDKGLRGQVVAWR